MSFHLGRPILAMLLVAGVTGGLIAFREKPARTELELWTFASSHADIYTKIHPDVARRLGSDFTVRLIPSNAMNVRLVSLFMADRSGNELPDVIEIRQDALGRYLGPPIDQISLLPLNDLLATTGERTIPSLDTPGTNGQSARLLSDGLIYTWRDGRWLRNAEKSTGDHWIDRFVRQRFSPYSKEGQIFGLPHDIHPTTLTYRADLFAEAGIDLETPTAGKSYLTWTDFRDRCERFGRYWQGKGIPDRRALDLFSANADILTALLLQRGVNIVEADGRVRLTDPIVRDTLLFYASLVAGDRRVATNSASAGRGVWQHDLEAGTVCAVITPDWRIADLRQAAPSLAGKWRMTRLPKFEDADAPTTTWGGTMIAIPRNVRDPAKAWKLVEAIYLSEPAMKAQASELGILPAVSDFWTNPAVKTPDPLFGGQVVNDLYVELAPRIPVQQFVPDTPYAVAALGYVLSQTVGALNHGMSQAELAKKVETWLATRQADVEQQIDHAKFPPMRN